MLENLKDGIYIIKASYIGYKTDTDSISISGEDLDTNLILISTTQLLKVMK